MEDIKTLHELLPDVIVYLLLGFTFVKIFKYVTNREELTEVNPIIVESIITGFVIKKVFELLPFTSHIYIVDVLCIFIATIIGSYFLGKLWLSEIFFKIKKFLKINRTERKYIWYDLRDTIAVYIDATNPDTKVRYFGKLKLIEESQRQPLILLKGYVKYIGDKEIVDYLDDNTRTVLLDTSKYTEIEITYQREKEWF